jgi:hypothetical protein
MDHRFLDTLHSRRGADLQFKVVVYQHLYCIGDHDGTRCGQARDTGGKVGGALRAAPARDSGPPGVGTSRAPPALTTPSNPPDRRTTSSSVGSHPDRSARPTSPRPRCSHLQRLVPCPANAVDVAVARSPRLIAATARSSNSSIDGPPAGRTPPVFERTPSSLTWLSWHRWWVPCALSPARHADPIASASLAG